jgi:adenylate cyclase class 2
MPNEIEAKMRVPDHAPIRDRLRELGAEPHGVAIETNVIFDRPDHSLQAAGSGLRVRRAKNTETGEVKQTVTYKGKLQKAALKTREEIELVIADGDAQLLIDRLGFIKIFSFEKRRESWELEGCHVELDEVPRLGTFVEIEGPGESAVMPLREKLGLGNSPLISTSYVGMMLQTLQQTGDASREVRLDEDSAN